MTRYIRFDSHDDNGKPLDPFTRIRNEVDALHERVRTLNNIYERLSNNRAAALLVDDLKQLDGE